MSRLGWIGTAALAGTPGGPEAGVTDRLWTMGDLLTVVEEQETAQREPQGAAEWN